MPPVGVARPVVVVGIGRIDVAEFAAAGIERCIILVQEDNVVAREFWRAVGGRFRRDLVAFSKDLP